MHLRIRLNRSVILNLPLTIQVPEISQLTSKTCMKGETTASFNGAHETSEITWVYYLLRTCLRFEQGLNAFEHLKRSYEMVFLAGSISLFSFN